MKYKRGMYGGSFDPLHIGHLRAIADAASQCEKLYIVLSYSRKRDFVPMEYRYRWIKAATKKLGNIEIILLEDDAVSKEEYDKESYWEAGRNYIIEKAGGPFDIVFCGSDYKETGRYESLYGCEVIYFDREELPISSTLIRENPLKHWEYLPKEVKPYFAKRVLIAGGESTGKSTLTEKLAQHYNTNFLEEVGRSVSEYAGSEELMIEDDFIEILLRHKTKELDLVKDSNKMLFIDTDALTTQFYSRFLLGEDGKRVNALSDAITAINKFDLILFLEPTVAFVQDGTRNPKIEAEREKYSQRIKDLFDEAGLTYYCIDGDYDFRFEESVRIIEDQFKI